MTTMSAQEFVNKWRGVKLKERSAAQEHFIDVCHLAGHPTPAESDLAGTEFTFEVGADKTGGGHGFADVWLKDHFAWEYKGVDGNLEKAFKQLLLYHDALGNPPLLIVSDLETIIIRTKFTNTVKTEYLLSLDDLLKPEKLKILRAAFFAPETLKPQQTPHEVTQAAAQEFGRLAQLLQQWGEEPHAIAHFLIRLLFCLFAEDIGLLPEHLFSRLVEKTRKQPTIFLAQLKQLFAAMAAGNFFGADAIPQFNGGLFNDDAVLELHADGLEVLRAACALDWGSIEPSILGVLFERSLDPSKRSQIGAHYTSRADIELIVEPVLMAPLRSRWTEVQARAHALAKQAEEVKAAAFKRRAQTELSALLRGFAAEIAGTKVLDPACGSGNFLYVALRMLHDLEKEVTTLSSILGIGGFLPAVGPEQLYGIELLPYAHELAQATVWIGHLQWLDENGYGASEPILKSLDNIVEMDAILAHDANGKAVEPEWPAVDVIVGNPPFLGGNKIRQELGDKYVDELFKLYSGRVPALADLVCYWYEKARALTASGMVRRVGLLATQAIRGGANREVLKRIKEIGDIFWAQSDRDWVLDGANVHVSMVGFDNGTEKSRMLDGHVVTTINPDLTAELDLTAAKQLDENGGICFMGASPKAPFDINEGLAHELLSAPININGRSNSDVVRPVASGIDLVRRSREMWTIDFGVLSREDAACYELPFAYVKNVVYPIRSKNRRKAYAQKWWQYAEARPGMRRALLGTSRYIATPEVAKHRIFVWARPEMLCNQQTLVFARDDDYFFGVLHSKVHEMWALRKGTALEDRPRYTPTSTFETFPFPWPPGKEPTDDTRVKAIAEAAKALVEQRDAWLNPPGASEAELKKRTLTNLYNARPTWLELAHKKLDDAVLDAYGWPREVGDEEILARLLRLNGERAGKGVGKGFTRRVI